MNELDGAVHGVELAGVLPLVPGLHVPQGDLAPVVAVDQTVLIINLYWPRSQEANTIFPGYHVSTYRESD